MLEALYIYITWQCNLSCRHCWVSAGMKQKKGLLSLELYGRIIEEAASMGITFIKISGGEPLICWNVTSYIIEKSRKLGLAIQVETNGTLMTIEKAFFLKKNNCQVSVSLDGPKVWHNDMRNDVQAYDQTIQGIHNLQKSGINPLIVYSFSERNDQRLETTIKLVKQLGISRLKLNPIMKIGRGTELGSNHKNAVFSVSAEDLLAIQNKFCVNNKNSLDIQIMLPMCTGFFSYLFDKKYSYVSCDCEKIISILPDGTVGLCGEAKDIEEFQYGNIENDSILNVIQKSRNYKALEHIEEKLQGTCNHCLLRQKCKGSCRIAAYLGENNIYSASPICEELEKQGKFFATNSKR